MLEVIYNTPEARVALRKQVNEWMLENDVEGAPRAGHAPDYMEQEYWLARLSVNFQRVWKDMRKSGTAVAPVVALGRAFSQMENRLHEIETRKRGQETLPDYDAAARRDAGLDEDDNVIDFQESVLGRRDAGRYSGVDGFGYSGSR